jgi:hypothetical protein
MIGCAKENAWPFAEKQNKNITAVAIATAALHTPRYSHAHAV